MTVQYCIRRQKINLGSSTISAFPRQLEDVKMGCKPKVLCYLARQLLRNPVKVSYVQWPAGLMPDTPEWERIRAEVRAEAPDILVSNEMPFGPWLAKAGTFDKCEAEKSIAAHEAGQRALADLGLPLAISSRPVWTGDRLANEAFALEAGNYLPLHQKQYFPDEAGWHEAEWYRAEQTSFQVHVLRGVRIGVLLCTEAMFSDRARAYGQQGADLLVVPRATGVSMQYWHIACSMAAIVSGAYVVSSNRVGQEAGGPEFGGGGMAFLPDSTPLERTSAVRTIASFDLDTERSRAQKAEYPCYVRWGVA